MAQEKHILRWGRLSTTIGISLIGLMIWGIMILTFGAQPAYAVCTTPNYAVVETSGIGAIYEIGISGTTTHVFTTTETADALARDPNDCNKLYYIGKSANKPLYSLDISTMTPIETLIGDTNLLGQVRKLGFNPANGQLYTMEDLSSIITISLSTAATSNLGSLSLGSSGGDLTFDEHGTLWMIHNNSLYTVNVTSTVSSGSATLLGPLPGGLTGLGSLGWGDDGFLYGVHFGNLNVYKITYTSTVGTELIGPYIFPDTTEVNDIASIHPVQTSPTAITMQSINVNNPDQELIVFGFAFLFLLVATVAILVRRPARTKTKAVA